MSKVCLVWGLGEGVFPKDNSAKRNSPESDELQMKLSRSSSSNRTGVVYFKLNFLSELHTPIKKNPDSEFFHFCQKLIGFGHDFY